MGAITVDALNAFYTSMAGVLFNKNETLLIQFPGGKTGSYTIPNSVNSIGNLAFRSCAGLTSVTIPNTVTSIGTEAFSGCSSLTSVVMPNSVPSIGASTFSGCASLTSITIPSSVTYIGNSAFARCGSLASVTIPAGVTCIANNVFEYCTNLTSVTNPLVATRGGSFGVRTNRFGFTITGSSNLTIVVVASTNLVNPAWIPVGTNTLTDGSAYFSDPRWRDYRTRFYRLRPP